MAVNLRFLQQSNLLFPNRRSQNFYLQLSKNLTTMWNINLFCFFSKENEILFFSIHIVTNRAKVYENLLKENEIYCSLFIIASNRATDYVNYKKTKKSLKHPIKFKDVFDAAYFKKRSWKRSVWHSLFKKKLWVDYNTFNAHRTKKQTDMWLLFF